MENKDLIHRFATSPLQMDNGEYSEDLEVQWPDSSAENNGPQLLYSHQGKDRVFGHTIMAQYILRNEATGPLLSNLFMTNGNVYELEDKATKVQKIIKSELSRINATRIEWKWKFGSELSAIPIAGNAPIYYGHNLFGSIRSLDSSYHELEYYYSKRLVELERVVAGNKEKRINEIISDIIELVDVIDMHLLLRSERVGYACLASSQYEVPQAGQADSLEIYKRKLESELKKIEEKKAFKKLADGLVGIKK